MDGYLIRRRRHDSGRRFYSVFDLLKLCVMQALVMAGVRPEIAAEAPALVDGLMTSADLAAFNQRKLPTHQLMFIRLGESLEVAHFRSLSGARTPFDSADEALAARSGVCGLLVDWPCIAGHVFAEVEEIEKRMGRNP